MRTPDPLAIGLCVSCAHVRIIQNRRGSVFYHCERSRNDSRFPKYPPLPVLQCSGWARREEEPNHNTEDDVTEPMYVTRAEIEKVEGLHRRAILEAGPTVDFGVHGPIKSLYGLETERDMPLPVDYVVAAAGG